MNNLDPHQDTTVPVNGTTTPTTPSEIPSTETSDANPPMSADNYPTDETDLVHEGTQDQLGSINTAVLCVDNLIPLLSLEDPQTGLDNVSTETTVEEGEGIDSKLTERSLQLD
ncbi:uncharacterized protein BO80DRAFT_424869 [Aspergillus ibericus CBS 121593]|uniref:Uncharacterized protein n=1 Tax=Aspergillus ibericus CBS 121593 TaxID=1448316 RepID=A0A395H283_9EURO|nr:hypothetical protein BO80DRAFT_424869 [Aspergillus ibericus CBS 121593]RAL01315.1 hypothetical protein BO80DRAFT_424869 [Aspergillus ibericus CBS 121593]